MLVCYDIVCMYIMISFWFLLDFVEEIFKIRMLLSMIVWKYIDMYNILWKLLFCFDIVEFVKYE